MSRHTSEPLWGALDLVSVGVLGGQGCCGFATATSSLIKSFPPPVDITLFKSDAHLDLIFFFFFPFLLSMDYNSLVMAWNRAELIFLFSLQKSSSVPFLPFLSSKILAETKMSSFHTKIISSLLRLN